MAEVPETSEVSVPVEDAAAANRIDLASPEFILAITLVVLFGAVCFTGAEIGGDLRGALISAMSMAVSYFLSTQRKKPVE